MKCYLKSSLLKQILNKPTIPAMIPTRTISLFPLTFVGTLFIVPLSFINLCLEFEFIKIEPLSVKSQVLSHFGSFRLTVHCLTLIVYFIDIYKITFVRCKFVFRLRMHNPYTFPLDPVIVGLIEKMNINENIETPIWTNACERIVSIICSNDFASSPKSFRLLKFTFAQTTNMQAKKYLATQTFDHVIKFVENIQCPDLIESLCDELLLLLLWLNQTDKLLILRVMILESGFVLKLTELSTKFDGKVSEFISTLINRVYEIFLGNGRHEEDLMLLCLLFEITNPLVRYEKVLKDTEVRQLKVISTVLPAAFG